MIVLAVLLFSVSPSCLAGLLLRGGGRVKRQAEDGDIKQGCTTTGYEKRYRELCEEEFEEVCKTVTTVETKKEIVTKCDTRLEQQCNTTTRAVPRQICVERNRTECFLDIKIVADTTYSVECENIVQHICEEHFDVPVPVPVQVPPPHFDPRFQLVNGKRKRRRKRQTSINEQFLQRLRDALADAPPPEVHHHEVPAPPGCRSLVTQKCHKVPVPIIKKIPDELCEIVPGVKCFLELVDIEEPQCFEVPMEECQDEVKETPFLVEEEECKDVPKIVCTEIEEEVPIQICRTIDILRTPIITQKLGQRTLNSRAGLGSRSKVVGRLPEVGDVGNPNAAALTREGGKRSGKKLSDLDRLRSQIFDNIEPSNKRARSAGQKSRNKRMKRILKQLLERHFDE